MTAAVLDAAAYAKRAANGAAAAEEQAARTPNLLDYGAERLTGPPPPVRWLVEGSIPLGVPAVLAAMGDTGKSYLTLQLCFHVSQEESGGNLDFHTPPILGGRIAAHGTAVFISSEDSEAEIHRRLAVIDPGERRRDRPGKLIVVSLPDAGGPMPFFVQDRRGGVAVTDNWKMICDQLAKIDDVRLACFDPLSTFAQVALDKDSTEAQFVAGQLGTLAAQTGATVLAPHHMRKAAEAPKNVAEARERIRGSSGIVDGVRVAYALWWSRPSVREGPVRQQGWTPQGGQSRSGAGPSTHRGSDRDAGGDHAG